MEIKFSMYKRLLSIKKLAIIIIFFLLNSKIYSRPRIINKGLEKNIQIFKKEKVARIEFKKKDEIYIKKYKHEKKMLLRLKHPNIISFANFQKPFCDESLILLLEAGTYDLRELINIKELSFLNFKQQLKIKLEILIDIIHGIQFIHKNGYVHRDIKPDNIILFIKNSNTQLINAKICDFTFTQKINSPAKKTGTPLYLSYNLLKNDYKYNFCDDIYAFAVLTFELIYNINLIEELKKIYIKGKYLLNVREFMKKLILEENWSPLQILHEKIDFINDLLEKCFSKNIEDIPTAKEIFKNLSFYLNSPLLNDLPNSIEFIKDKSPTDLIKTITIIID